MTLITRSLSSKRLASLVSKSTFECVARWSGDVIRRTGMKNFNAVSHNRARPYFRIQHGRGEVRSSYGLLECSFSDRKCGRLGRHGMICWVLAMEMLQGVWKQHLRPRTVVGYGVKIFLPSPPNYVTRSPGVSKSTFDCVVFWPQLKGKTAPFPLICKAPVRCS